MKARSPHQTSKDQQSQAGATTTTTTPASQTQGGDSGREEPPARKVSPSPSGSLLPELVVPHTLPKPRKAGCSHTQDDSHTPTEESAAPPLQRSASLDCGEPDWPKQLARDRPREPLTNQKESARRTPRR